MPPSSRRTAATTAVLALVALLAACSDGQSESQAGNGGAPPPEVAVIEVSATSVPVSAELPGRTSAYMIAEIRPQVGGIIEERRFTEGAEVKRGELLYQIDAATYAAEVDSARAAVARAEANAEAARVRSERYAELVKIKAVSTQAYDDAIAAHKQAQAEIASSRAALKRAEINLEYTRVTSPIAGRIGRSTVTAGALVTASQAQALATVQQLDPIYVDLTQSGNDMRALRRAVEAGRVRRDAEGETPVQLVFEDGTDYEHEGRLAFSEVSVDPDTGSVTLRALFPNPEQRLLPGMYVRARIDQGTAEGAITLPHAAVQRDPRGNPLAMVVNGDDEIESRPLTIQRATSDAWIVTDGLEPGDRVVVEGLQRIRPGAKVSVADSKEQG